MAFGHYMTHSLSIALTLSVIHFWYDRIYLIYFETMKFIGVCIIYVKYFSYVSFLFDYALLLILPSLFSFICACLIQFLSSFYIYAW